MSTVKVAWSHNAQTSERVATTNKTIDFKVDAAD